MSDNHVHHVGLTYPSGIGISGVFFRRIRCGNCLRMRTSQRGLQTTNEPGVRIAHNLVHDTSYSAIICDGHNNFIEGNLIYRAMRELADGAGIYMAMCRNNVIRGNFVRDIAESGGFGCLRTTLMKGRELCCGGQSVGQCRKAFANHLASNNTIRNNLFIVNSDGRITLRNCSGFSLSRSGGCTGGDELFRYRADRTLRQQCCL